MAGTPVRKAPSIMPIKCGGKRIGRFCARGGKSALIVGAEDAGVRTVDVASPAKNCPPMMMSVSMRRGLGGWGGGSRRATARG